MQQNRNAQKACKIETLNRRWKGVSWPVTGPGVGLTSCLISHTLSRFFYSVCHFIADTNIEVSNQHRGCVDWALINHFDLKTCGTTREPENEWKRKREEVLSTLIRSLNFIVKKLLCALMCASLILSQSVCGTHLARSISTDNFQLGLKDNFKGNLFESLFWVFNSLYLIPWTDRQAFSYPPLEFENLLLL